MPQITFHALADVVHIGLGDSAIHRPQVRVEERFLYHVRRAAHAEECPFGIDGATAVAPEAVSVLVNDSRDLVFVEVVRPAVDVAKTEVDAASGADNPVDDLIGWRPPEASVVIHLADQSGHTCGGWLDRFGACNRVPHFYPWVDDVHARGVKILPVGDGLRIVCVRPVRYNDRFHALGNANEFRTHCHMMRISGGDEDARHYFNRVACVQKCLDALSLSGCIIHAADDVGYRFGLGCSRLDADQHDHGSALVENAVYRHGECSDFPQPRRFGSASGDEDRGVERKFLCVCLRCGADQSDDG